MEEASQTASGSSVVSPELPEEEESSLAISLPQSSLQNILRLNQRSETYTQPNENVASELNNEIIVDSFDHITDIGNTVNSSVTINPVWHSSILSYNASIGGTDSSASHVVQSYDDSNQSTLVIPATSSQSTELGVWRGRSGIYDDNSNSAQSSRSVFFDDCSSTVVSVNEEATSSVALPEATEAKNDTEEPPSKVRKINSPKQGDDVDGETCPICLESWDNSGEHRLVSLKCGHLFGAQCVERWLKAQNSKDRSCPTCKSKASLKDIRYIYAKRLVAADTGQISELQKQIILLKAEKHVTDLELQKSRIAHRTCRLQLELLRNTLLKTQVPKETTPRPSWRFALQKNMPICPDGGCRVLTYNCRTYEFYVSQKSTNNLFPGFGIRKVSCIDYKLGHFVHLHPKPIRDMTYSQPRDLLLSVGLDKTARIVERGIHSATIQCGLPLWSCSWDYLRSNEFYVGGIGGTVHKYDVRNPRTYMQRHYSSGDLSPVVSLSSTEYGLLTCQLNTCCLWLTNSPLSESRTLPLDGPFMSLNYDNESRRALISRRASATERSRLTLYKLRPSTITGEIHFDIEQSFAGSTRSTLMSRSAWVKTAGGSWIAAHSESDSALLLHGMDGTRTMSLPAVEPALDVCTAQFTGDTVLAALSETRLRLYKAEPTNS